MKVSIVVPIYNCEKYVRRCLESIAAQDYPDIECILVDDCGTDKSMAIARDFISSYNGPIGFKILSHDANRGAAIARNTGIAEAMGEYIYFADADDVLAPSCIVTMAKFVSTNRSVDIVQGKALFTRHDESDVYEKLHMLDFVPIVKGQSNLTMAELFLTFRFPWTPWNKLVKKSVIIDNDVLFYPQLRRNEDFLWTYQLSLWVKNVVFSEEDATYIYNNEADGGITLTSTAEINAAAWKVIIQRVMELPLHHGKSRSLATRFILRFFYQWRQVKASGYDELEFPMAKWLWRCGARYQGALLWASAKCRHVALARKFFNVLLWRNAVKNTPSNFA